MQLDWCRQVESWREGLQELVGGEAGIFLGRELGEGLRELGVAIFLVGGGLGDDLLRGGELRGELGAIAAVGLPGEEKGQRDDRGDECFDQTQRNSSGHVDDSE